MLGEADTLNSLSKKFDRLLCMEAIGKSTPQLANGQPRETSKSAASKSAYKKGKNVPKGASNKQSPQQCVIVGSLHMREKTVLPPGKLATNATSLGTSLQFARVQNKIQPSLPPHKPRRLRSHSPLINNNQV